MKLFDRKIGNEMASFMRQNFHLIMIAEHFDESMVLLAELLCWPLEAVASFKHNVRLSEKKVNL